MFEVRIWVQLFMLLAPGHINCPPSAFNLTNECIYNPDFVMCFISGLNLCETNVGVVSVFRLQGALQAAAPRGESA